jgi:hypothetical protein
MVDVISVQVAELEILVCLLSKRHPPIVNNSSFVLEASFFEQEIKTWDPKKKAAINNNLFIFLFSM